MANFQTVYSRAGIKVMQHKVMTTYVALLRAVNVGGTGKLPMSALKSMCADAGFDCVETYIASGNVVFQSKAPEAKVKKELERRLHEYAGKAVDVIVRNGDEMAAILKANPFPGAPGNLAHVIFLSEPLHADALSKMTGQKDEEVKLGLREIYVYYPSGAGQSKLKIPAAKTGTARNINTVAKLADMCGR